ncbi:hypothetical protein MMC12_001426 [Toensbergia leucococca]|nr:hypothetical protein [Toensbergia leucococca]
MKVAIIGGGLAAPALALHLHSHSISCTIYEALPSSAQETGTVTLTPNSLRILDALDLYAPIRSHGGNFEAVTLVNAGWNPLAAVLMGSAKHYGYASLRIPRQTLRQTLLRKVKEKGIEIQYKMKCSSIVENEDSANAVTITFTNGQIVSADFAVGADGFYSTVRRHIAPSSAPPEYVGLLNLGGTITRESLQIPDSILCAPCSAFSQNNFFALMPHTLDNTQLSFIATFAHEDLGREGWNALARNPKELKSMLQAQYCTSPWPDWLQEALNRVPESEIKSWPYHLLPPLKTYLSPHLSIALLGDAAHGMPPTGAQGANLALEDAATLALILATAASSDDPHRRQTLLLRAWDRHRRERVGKVTAYTMRGSRMIKPAGGPWVQVLKEWVIWAVNWWVGVEGGMGWLYGYRVGSVLEGVMEEEG